MDAGVIASVIAATLNAGTPLLIAAIGILIHEQAVFSTWVSKA